LFHILPNDGVAAAGVFAGVGALVGGYQVAVVAFLDGDPEDSVAAAGFLAGVGATVMGVLVGIVAFFAGFYYAIATSGSRNRATTSDQQECYYSKQQKCPRLAQGYAPLWPSKCRFSIE
jgi:hypothetical protein